MVLVGQARSWSRFAVYHDPPGCPRLEIQKKIVEKYAEDKLEIVEKNASDYRLDLPGKPVQMIDGNLE